MAIAPGLSFLLLSHLKPPTYPQEDILRFQKKKLLSPIAKQDYFHVLILEFFKYLFILPSGSECAVQAGDSALLFHIFLLSHCYLYSSSAVQISCILCKVLNERNCCQLPSECWSRAQLAAALQLSKYTLVTGTVVPAMVKVFS